MARKRVARHVAGHDSEDDGEGNPFLWCFTHDGGSYSTRYRPDALTFLSNLTRDQAARNRRVEVWATNLEYDLVNLFEPERLQELSFRFGRSALCGATWRGCDFRDTMRHLPVSVAELGEMIGLSKRHARMFKEGAARTDRQYLERCQRDATITYRAAKRLHEAYTGFKVYPRTTLASTALGIWEKHFWKQRLYRPRQDVYAAARAAYHGGRTQAFAVGTFERIHAIDVASMFPWAMLGEMPLPWGLVAEHRAGDRLAPLGLYRVQVESELAVPTLPVRTKAGTLFPNGRWSGWYTGEEILAFVKAGGRAYVRSGFRFLETCRPFDGYVAAMFRRKSRARGVRRLLYKLLLNALYGKFGQRGRLVRVIPMRRFLALARAPLTWREWNGLAIFSQEGAPPIWGNMVWAAFVTARARVRLAREIQELRARGARPLYCDTDSIMFQGPPGRYPAKAVRIGDFERRGTFPRGLIIGKKEYALDRGRSRWQVHAKGIPYAERMRYLETGQATFRRPVRFKEAARDGGQANVWREVTKQRRKILVPGADGTLPTPYLTGDGE